LQGRVTEGENFFACPGRAFSPGVGGYVFKEKLASSLLDPWEEKRAQFPAPRRGRLAVGSSALGAGQAWAVKGGNWAGTSG